MPLTGFDPVRPDLVYEDSGICEPAFTNRNVGVRSEVVVEQSIDVLQREQVGEASPVGVREHGRPPGPGLREEP